jgi:L-ascorbate metabolism protein UlaG (beta-lactamase superfamily)
MRMNRIVGIAVLVGVALGLALCAGAEPVTVTFLGHSCFTIQGEDGEIIMIDPYATYVPYPSLPQAADVVLTTHAHIDHCPRCYGETDRYTGDPIEVFPWDSEGRTREGTWRITEDLVVQFIEATHVTLTGGGQGYVTLFAFDVGGIRFAHLADLGRVLNTDQITALGDVDVLFIPVGGAFTIDAAEALTVIGQLPTVKIVFPMHYYVDGITPWTDMAPLSEFTQVADVLYDVVEYETAHVVLDADALPDDVEVWTLPYLE